MRPLALPLSAGGQIATWVPEKCLDRGSLKCLGGPSSLGVSQARAPTLDLGAAPISAIQRVPRVQAHLARLPSPSPRLPATLRFRGLLRKAPEPPWLSLLSWAWRGEWAGSRAVPQETSPPHLVSQGWRVVVLGPDLGCHGGIRHGGCERHRQPFPTRPAGPGLQGTADREVSEVAFQNNGASACLHSGQDKQ